MARNRIIGRDNKLPWHIPEELRLFKKTTMGFPMIMGRKTFDSFPAPLPGRRHIVLSRNREYTPRGGEYAPSLTAALDLCHGADKVFIIGGAQIFTQAISLATSMILTFIDRNVDGDVSFPLFSENEFTVADTAHYPDASEPFTVITYDRCRKYDILVKKLEPKKKQGLVVILTGNGKGKTTSALGMALRGCGHNLRTTVVQFMKGDLYSGEWDGVTFLAPLVKLYHTGKGFCGIEGNPFPHSEHRKNAQEAILLVESILAKNDCDTLILDEINNALQLNLVDLQQVKDILGKRPPSMHMILTGRDAHPELIALADTASEVREIKHAYRKKIEPQPGIDY